MASDDCRRPGDLVPRDIKVYGYCVMYRQNEGDTWRVDLDDEYRHIPAHYLFMEEAMDRVVFLRERGLFARVAALLMEPTDSVEVFERNKLVQDEG
ncbi:MAG: hypothetical protein ACKOHK_14130 [Planctomycetia bacterium]